MAEKFYTGVGSRECPKEICNKMTKIATRLCAKGFILRSGGANGADWAFESGAGENKEIYIPWNGFKNDFVKYHEDGKKFFLPKPEAFEIAEKFHPAWEKCSKGARALHARNVHQVLGLDLKTPTNLLICWTKNGKDVGGTATAIKIARSHNIKIINLFDT